MKRNDASTIKSVTTPTPFPHQREMMRALIEVRMAGKEKALGVMASGTGKTLVVAFDTQGYFIHSEPNVLIICHSKQLLYQHKEEFQRVFGDTCKYGMFIGPEKSIDEDTNFVFATFQSLREHLEEFSPDMFDYIWVDEAHHTPAKTFLTVVNHFRPKFLLGLTATPIREDGASLDDTFGAPIYELDLIEAWHRDLLSPVECRVFTDYIEGIEAYLDSGERVSWAQLNRTVFVKQRDEKIVQIIMDQIQSDGTTVCFCRNIAHAERIAQFIPGAKSIHSKLSDNELANRLRDFRDGNLKIVTAVDILNEGIDIPHIDNLVFLRPTQSLRVLLQELGRGLRKVPGKESVTVYDFVDNCEHLEMLFALERTERERIQSSTEHETRPCFELTIETPKFHERKLDLIELLERARSGGFYSDEELLEMLKEFTKKLGKTPIERDLRNDPSMPSGDTYERRFGSWNNALKAAGLQINNTDYSDEELIEMLREFAEKLGKTPSIKDLRKDPSMPSAKAYRDHFGKWNNALKAAGLQINLTYCDLTDEEMLEALRKLAEKLGKTPTHRDTKKESSMPSANAYIQRFGTWNNALKLAGLQVNKKHRHMTDEELLEALRKLAKKLGKTPRQQDLSKDSSMPSSATYIKRFGGWNNAIRMAGLQINKNFSDKELLDMLRDFAKKLGKTPSLRNLEKDPSMPSAKTFTSHFGSWLNALELAGLITS